MNLRPDCSVFGLVMAAPNTVRDFGNTLDIDVIGHEYLVAGGTATLASNRVNAG